MKVKTVFYLCLCCFVLGRVSASSSEEVAELVESCCTHGETFAVSGGNSRQDCASAEPPDDLEPDQIDKCLASVRSCCEKQFKQKEDCAAGMEFAPAKRCSVPKTDIGKTCCEECSIGRWTGESQGKESCGDPADEYVSPTTGLRKNAYHQCCLEAAEKPETTTEKKIITTTERKIETTTKKRETCEKKNPCEHICEDSSGVVTCRCREGFRLQADQKSCKDINECAEYQDDLCTTEGTVCHNMPGTFKCVPIKKREVGITCPPGFKRNVANQVCDDINECQLPNTPCPRHLCVNTIGGFKCGGKPGKPALDDEPQPTTPRLQPISPKTDNMCPPGFRDGPDDDCVDINECDERLDDCQRLSQYCINTHGNFFCQDHVSKRCAPGFVVDRVTGICQDIDECEDSPEACGRGEVCVNLPGAYDCRSKNSALPTTSSKTCQEGTRLSSSGNNCEDIDECREGTHLCDPLQNCINTYGGHECRCKHGFELDPASGSCVDIDECAVKPDSCPPEMHCLNVPGSFACTRKSITSTSPKTVTHAPEEYEYYYSDEYEDDDSPSKPNNKPASSTRRPNRRPPVGTTPRARPTIPSSTTSRPTTTSSRPTTTTSRPSTTRRTTTTSTTPKPTTPKTTTPPPTTPAPTTPTPRPTTRTPPTPRPTTPRPRTTNSPRLRPTYAPTTPRKPNPPRPAYPEPYRPPSYPFTNEPPTEIPREYSTTLIPDINEVNAPRHPDVIEKEKDKDGTYSVDTGDIPKDRWTNVIGRDPDPDFDIDNLHCLNGYEKNSKGECVDMNECSSERHVCNGLEVCENQPGSYSCVCMAGFERDPTGWCVSATTPRDTPTTSRVSSTTSTTTRAPDLPTDIATESSPNWRYNPQPRWRPREQSRVCELGYHFDQNVGSCVDIDECHTGKASCSTEEQCVNTEGGYKCVCGQRCHGNTYPTTYAAPRPHSPPYSVGHVNTITVGSQYGQRGPRTLRPSYSRLQDSGAIHVACPWGYSLTSDKRCVDIDECAKKISECGPEQSCENFFGGYSCQCPTGHKLSGNNRCEDIDECSYGQTCSSNAQCENTIGSYRCVCGEGFRNAASNARVCVDVDECTEQPEICHQGCVNVWGGYRCTCFRGYQLDTDNRTCVDVDECAAAGTRGAAALCPAACLNTPGGYRCECPSGYRPAGPNTCIDIDECETGEATCANQADQGVVCQNTRGSYHCHKIKCPEGYRLESKHICRRIQQYCPITDMACIKKPSTYSYNFITFVSNIYLTTGSVDLFTVHGPSSEDSILNFELRMVDVEAPPDVRPADISCFDMRPSAHHCVISLVCSLQGPQMAEMELSMSVYRHGRFLGSTVARVIVVVSKYGF